ncbi:hypothetical protein G6F22_008495 [Rhizopus arrhizus]|nr:hypothetical protein G6F22_008495 [Rhizopus arrhizus]KAG1220282.1 hypothetical protein G6F35_006819 [Rhizopus arrhizus]
MFIGIIGPKSSGKHTIAEYLVNRHGFEFLTIRKNLDVYNRDVYSNARYFDNIDNMQVYVTERWQDNFITCDIDCKDLDMLRKRPFFLLLAVEAPVTMRYKRSVTRCEAQLEKKNSPSLEEFLIQDDRNIYNISAQDTQKTHCYKSLHNMMTSSDLIVTNAYQDVSSLYETLDKMNIVDKERLRPSWDTYFMQLSDLAARRSNCMKRRVGCILVKDSRVVATGYNGTPRGLRNCNEGGCGRCNEGAPCGTGLDRCLCMHAEENALLEAGRGSVNFETGVILYYVHA